MARPEILKEIDLAGDERRRMSESACHAADFKVCRNRVRICANTADFVESFRRWYRNFEEPVVAGQAPDLTICGWEAAGHSGAGLTFLVRDRAFRLSDPALIREPFPTIEHLLIANLRTHYFVHGACVSRSGRAIVLSGESGMGKTTLTGFLVSRGMGFLSDEIAALDRRSGRVDPFPLPLGIRPGPADELADGAPADIFHGAGETKRLVQARDLGGSEVRGPIPLHAVVFLSRRLSAAVETVRRFSGGVRLTLLGSHPAFEDELRRATGAAILGRDPMGDRLVCIRLDVPDSATFLPELRATADLHGVGVAAIEYENLSSAGFEAEPRLARIPAAAGVLELAKKIPSIQKAEIIRNEMEGRMPRLLEELSSLVRDVPFFKLSPGRLDGMIAAIEGLP